MFALVNNQFNNYHEGMVKNCQGKLCSVEHTAGLIAKKWTLLIIRDLLNGKKRFNELIQSLEDISPRTLSMRLNELRKNKLISKKVVSNSPLKVEYSLTDKGKDLGSIINQMKKWGDKYPS